VRLGSQKSCLPFKFSNIFIAHLSLIAMRDTYPPFSSSVLYHANNIDVIFSESVLTSTSFPLDAIFVMYFPYRALLCVSAGFLINGFTILYTAFNNDRVLPWWPCILYVSFGLKFLRWKSLFDSLPAFLLQDTKKERMYWKSCSSVLTSGCTERILIKFCPSHLQCMLSDWTSRLSG
jgi:hypothetical protein